MKKFVEELNEKIPSGAQLSEVQVEGSKIILYSKNPEYFSENPELIKTIVSNYKKRVDVRATQEILADPDKARQIINELVPDEAGIENVTFVTDISRVIIEADKPGLVIGRGGATLKEIKEKIKWSPRVERVPVMKSKIVDTVRQVIYTDMDARKKFLEKLGKKLLTKSSSGGQKEEKRDYWVRMTALGGFRQVGRSSVFVQTPESRVLIDCGVNVAATGTKEFPYLNAPEFKIADLDAVVVTHAHLDHSGAIPYLFKYGYDGPVYSTPPTRDLMTMLQLDYVDIAQREAKKVPYGNKDIHELIKHSIVLDYKEVTDITSDMRLTFYNAGHILGSAQAHLHIGDGLHNLIYTGDLKYAKTNLLDQAETNFMRLETLIMESTYGGRTNIQQSLEIAEQQMTDVIKNTIRKGGKVLIPVLAVGRAQEVMIALDKIVRKESMDGLKCYLDGMIWDATAIHSAYPEYLSSSLKQKMLNENTNPFLSGMFKRIGGHKEREELITSEVPALIMATSGMMQGGPSVEYFRRLAENPDNSIVFVAYQPEGCLGRRIQKGIPQISVEKLGGGNEMVNVKMDVNTISGFSGHSDRNQLMNFVSRARPRPERVLTCHGESSRCIDLASSIYKTFKFETSAPKNLETVRVR